MRSIVLTVLLLGAVPAFADHANDETHEDGSGSPESGLTQTQDQSQGQAQFGSVDGNFSGNTTVVNPNLDIDSSDFRKHAESAPRVEGSESGCQSGASGQSGTFGGSIGGASAACDAINAVRAIHLAESQGERAIANVTRVNAIVRNSARVLLSIVTLGLL